MFVCFLEELLLSHKIGGQLVGAIKIHPFSGTVLNKNMYQDKLWKEFSPVTTKAGLTLLKWRLYKWATAEKTGTTLLVPKKNW